MSRQLKRYHRLRKIVVKKLGGKCVECGFKKFLQLDHKDKNNKTIEVGKIFNLSLKRIWEEALKCQLLCKDCHIDKTRKDLGQKDARKTHGTLSSYRYCKCQLCKKAIRDWTRQYRAKKRIQVAKEPLL